MPGLYIYTVIALHVISIESPKYRYILMEFFILKANVIHFCTIFADALKFTICHGIQNLINYVIWAKIKGHPVVMRLWTSMGSWRGFIIYIIANVSIKIGNLGVLYSTTVCTFIERG